MRPGNVAILARSPKNDPWVDKIENNLTRFDGSLVRRVASAHRVPEKSLDATPSAAKNLRLSDPVLREAAKANQQARAHQVLDADKDPDA